MSAPVTATVVSAAPVRRSAPRVRDLSRLCSAPSQSMDEPAVATTKLRATWCELGQQRAVQLAMGSGEPALVNRSSDSGRDSSQVVLGDVLSAGPVLAATGPAVFAAAVAVTRFAVSALGAAHPTGVLLIGAAAAAAGTTVLATGSSVSIALFGLGLAAAGTAVLYPTLLSLATAQVDEASRGAATSVVATTAYLGFLAGPHLRRALVRRRRPPRRHARRCRTRRRTRSPHLAGAAPTDHRGQSATRREGLGSRRTSVVDARPS
jgi:hypothetical protein